MDKINIIVSCPTLMHAHQFSAALYKTNRLKMFITTIWYKPNSRLHKFISAIPIIGKKIRYSLLKRYYDGLPANKVMTHSIGEIVYQIKKQIPYVRHNQISIYYRADSFDKYVAKTIKEMDYDIFVGCEENSLYSFKTAKQHGKITILDLTQVHWKYLEYLRKKYPIFKSIQQDNVFYRASAIKEEEYKYVDYIITSSAFARDTLVNNGIASDKIRVIGLGFDTLKFKCKEVYNINSKGPLKLLFAGSITRRKGINLILQAVKQLENVELTIVGPMAEKKEYLDKYNVKFTYFPFLHHNDLAEQFKNTDLFVFPSYLDSWGKVVLEAMACGTPVIVTENTGSKDVVMQGGGKIIPVDDLESLKSAINYYKDNRILLEEDGKKASVVAQNYTWENYYMQVNNAISEIINESL